MKNSITRANTFLMFLFALSIIFASSFLDVSAQVQGELAGKIIFVTSSIDTDSKQLKALDLADMQIYHLLDFENHQASHFALSPDGTQIAWTEDSLADSHINVFMSNLDGSSQTQLISLETHPASLGAIAWSPDGKFIALATLEGIYALNVQEHTISELINEPADYISWSPDGSRIAFTYQNCIRFANADGSGAECLLSGATQPRWSPDSEQVAGYSGHGMIFTANATSLETTDLYPTSFQYPIVWSYDGEYLVSVEGIQSKAVFYTVRADTESPFPNVLAGVDPDTIVWDILAWVPDDVELAMATLEVVEAPTEIPPTEVTAAPITSNGDVIRLIAMGTEFNNDTDCEIVEPLTDPIVYPADAKQIAIQVVVDPTTATSVSIRIDGGDISDTGFVGINCNKYAIVMGSAVQSQYGVLISLPGETEKFNPGQYTLVVSVNGVVEEVPFEIQGDTE